MDKSEANAGRVSSSKATWVPLVSAAPTAWSTHLAPLAVVHAPHKNRQLAVGHHVKIAHLISRGVPRMHGVGLQGNRQAWREGRWVGEWWMGGKIGASGRREGGKGQDGSALAGSAAALRWLLPLPWGALLLR